MGIWGIWVGVSGLVLYLQVWLRHDAALAQQGHSREAVGTAVEQELPLRGAVAAATSRLPLIWSSFSLGGHPRNPRSLLEFRVPLNTLLPAAEPAGPGLSLLFYFDFVTSSGAIPSSTQG